MTAPAVAAQRFAQAVLLGLPLGLIYGFLRPLRPRFAALADGIFVLLTGVVWLYHSFALCRGDLRLGYAAGLAAGAFSWEWTLGRLLRRPMKMFWRIVGELFGIFLIPAKNFLKFAKILFAYVKKWVTIKGRNRRHHRHGSGGSPNERIERVF